MGFFFNSKSKYLKKIFYATATAEHRYHRHGHHGQRAAGKGFVTLCKTNCAMLKVKSNHISKVTKLLKKTYTSNPVNGKQMTVTWHVDDLKVTHMNSNEVTKCIKNFKKIYGNRMTVHRGKVHDYLGTDLDFSSVKALKIGMIKYIKKIHDDFPEEIKSAPATPAAEYLFDVHKDNRDKILPEEQALAFHHTPAQLLFLSARARPDTRTPVSFLCTRTMAQIKLAGVS